MNKNLVDNNFLIIPNFISAYRSNKLKEEFKKFSGQNDLSGDDQSLNSKCFYNYISFLELLCEKTPKISEILEETVLPTYTYARIYEKNSILEPHVDRDACEISLTLHLGGDSSWPICIKTPSGKDTCVVLNPGDAMMYLGCEATHWREKYQGNEYIQVFLHYVRSRGDKFYTYFDKTSTNNVQKVSDQKDIKIIEKQINTTNSLISNSFDSDLNSNSSDKCSIFLNIKPDNKLEDFVEVFDNVVSDKVCDLILNEYSHASEWQHAKIGNNMINFNVRNCGAIPISDNSVISNNFDFRKELDTSIFQSISRAKELYNEKHKTLHVSKDTGYDLLRYTENQFYIQHIDSYGGTPDRIISCSIQLNDDYEGGEFALFNKQMLIKAKKGSIIMFPSNFMYPHEILKVTKGTRYSIVTWLV